VSILAIPVSIFLVLLLQIAGAQNAQQTTGSTIEGLVVRAGTNEPIERARITIQRIAGPGAVPPQSAISIPPVNTDGRGKFVIKELEAGSYRLTAARNGFARQEYGERAPGRSGIPLNLVVGQNLKDITFRLVPAGAVVGRVSDSSGEPLAGMTVQLLRSTYDPQGGRTFQPVTSGRTNDRGEYRLYWVTPGRYFLNASPARSPLDFGPFGNSNEVTDQSYVVTYFPGTIDMSKAASLDVPAGAEVGPIDFRMDQQQLFRIRGRVVNTRTGQPPRNANVSATPRNPTSGFFISAAGSNYNPANGTFELRDIAPGEYLVRAFAIDPGVPGDALRNVAQTPVDVSSSDVENVALLFGQGISIPVRVSLDGGGSISSLPNFDRIRVFLSNSATNVFITPPLIKSDGTALIENVPPGEYRVSLPGIPPTVFLKSAVLGQTDALQAGLSISGPVSGPLDIVISQNAGEIAGTVVDKDGKPVSGIQAVLIPDRSRDRRDLYKVANSDQNGHFNLRGVAPGDYKIFPWEDIEPFAYSDPDFLRRYEQMGIPIKISESAKLTVEAKMIAAGQ